MARLKFQIYYADGSVLDGVSTEDWLTAPSEGLLIVVEIYDVIYGPPFRRRHACKRWAGLDYYWMAMDDSLNGGSAKFIPAGAVVKAGQQVSNAIWEEIYNRASQDPAYVCIN